MIDIEKITKEARVSFPNAKTDIEALCLNITYLRGLQGERVNVMNLNAQQAAMLASAYMENDKLRKMLEARK